MQKAQVNGHAQPSLNAQTLVQRAMEALNRGDATNAVVFARNAASAAPDEALPWAILCVALHRAGSFEPAIEAGRKAVVLDPASAEYQNNLGVVLRAAGKLREAEAAYRAAMVADPRFASAYSNLANLARDEGRNQEAEKNYRAALAIADNAVDVWQGLSGVLQRLGKWSEARAALERAIALKPDRADIICDLAMNFASRNETPEALRLLHKAIEINPNLDTAYGNLGAVHLRGGQLAAAEKATRRAAELAPREQRWLSNLGVTAKDLGRFDEAESLFRRALELKPDYATGHANLLFCLNYHPDRSAEEIFAEYRRFDAAHARPHMPATVLSHGNDPTPGRRLRVGYLSPDFREHAARHFLFPLLEHYDRQQIELYCYAEVANPDRITEEFKALASHWRPTIGLSDDEVAALIRKDAIDILVDFGGHTSSSRILAMARRPAPIQIAHHLGHGYTSGMSSVDVFISDAEMAPVGSEHLFAERIVRLPRIPVAYVPPKGMPGVAPLPALTKGYVTFGYFGRTERLNHRVVKAWSEILARVPGSRLMLNSKAFAEPGFCDLMAERFAVHGLSRDRLEMVFTSPQSRTWAAYGEVDIALDPFPHNAGTTTIEAMWLGVPVVSVKERPSVGRFGASHLAAVGLLDWLAPDAGSYVALAVSKARDVAALAKLRAGLRDRLSASPLCDGKGLARDMENAYRALWIEWCNRAKTVPAASSSVEQRIDALQAEAAKAYGAADYARAVALFAEAVKLAPRAEILSNLGAALKAAGRMNEAEAAYRNAIERAPNFSVTYNNLGNLLFARGRNKEAELVYRRALEIQPDEPQSLRNLGVALMRQQRLPEAEPYLRRAVALSPANGDFHDNLAQLLRQMGQPVAALGVYQATKHLFETNWRALGNMALLLQDLGRFDEAENTFRRALTLKPDYALAHANLLFCVNYHPNRTAEEILAEYKRFDAAQARPHLPAALRYENDATPGRRLRVGYVSPDFRDHAARYFIEPLLTHYDRTKIELFCYAEVENTDHVTRKFQGLADQWRSTVGLTDDEVASQIRRDRIDILMDLGGHTSSSRLLVLARKPAPVQVAYLLGHGYTSGLSAIDAFLADAQLVPPGSEKLFTEQVVRLPRIPLAYVPPDGMPEVAPLPALQKSKAAAVKAGGKGKSSGKTQEKASVTFGYFGRPERINEHVVEAWSKILKGTPDSRLMLNSKAFAEAAYCALFAERFAGHGIGADRLAMVYTSPQPETWAAYGQVDIALDPFPHNAGTTTIEALWLGVPVVSIADRPSVGRMGASILGAVGLADWVTKDAESYVKLAIAKAKNLEALAKLRGSLRKRFEASPLRDGAGLARDIEGAFRALWTTWCATARSDGIAGTLDAAIAAFQVRDYELSWRNADRRIALQPADAEARHLRGIAAYRLGRLPEAAVDLVEAAGKLPGRADVRWNLTVVLKCLGRLKEAEAYGREAVHLAPNAPEAHNNLASVLKDQGRQGEAEAHYRRAVTLKPDYADAWSNLAWTLALAGNTREAESAARRALALNPRDTNAMNNIGTALMQQDRLREAADWFARAVETKPDFAVAHSNLLFCLNYRTDLSASEIYAAYRKWDAAHAQPLMPVTLEFDNLKVPDRRLKVGYVSPDFRYHAASFFVEQFIAAHDRSQFEITCYAEVVNPDAVTERFKHHADRWRSTVGMSDAALAAQIRADGIDVLVDLAGHTGGNRLLSFARKPAPVQVAHMVGSGTTTGLDAMDAFLADERLVPKGAEQYFSERVVRLSRIPLIYAPPPGMPDVSAPPALRNGYVTFGCFSRTARINEGVIGAWAGILNAVPGARLVLNSKPFRETASHADWLARFAAYGVAKERVSLLYTVPQPKTWEAYGGIDIALDPFPHNAGTTTIEALWLGVPVVSLASRPPVGRFGAAILGVVGLDDWVASDVQGYMRRAVAAASDLSALAGLRATLRQRFKSSPLGGNPAALAREIEAAYRRLWIEYCSRSK